MIENRESRVSALRIVTSCRTADEVVPRFSRYCDGESLFIAMKTPKPLGKRVRFELTLMDGELLMGGGGPVIESYDTDGNRFKKPGVRIRIDEVDEAGRQWLDRFRERAAAPARTRATSVAVQTIEMPEPISDKPDRDPIPRAVGGQVSEGWDLGGPPPFAGTPTPAASPAAGSRKHIAPRTITVPTLLPRVSPSGGNGGRPLPGVTATGKARPRGRATSTSPPIWDLAVVSQTVSVSTPVEAAPAASTPPPPVLTAGDSTVDDLDSISVDTSGFETEIAAPPAIPVQQIEVEVTGVTELPRAVAAPDPVETLSRPRRPIGAIAIALACGAIGYLLGAAGGADAPSERPLPAVAAVPVAQPEKCTSTGSHEPAPAAVSATELATSARPTQAPPAGPPASDPDPAASPAPAAARRAPPPACVLQATSTPPGAQVFVDGHAIGRTPLRRLIHCGRSHLKFEIGGRSPAFRSVAPHPGQTARVSVALESAPRAAPPRSKKPAPARRPR